MSKKWNISHEIIQDDIQFTIRWSPWGLMDKWVVKQKIPSEAGLFQIWVNRKGALDLLTSELAYYGGLRNTLREVVDELAYSGERLRKIIGEREAWFRFTTLNSRKHLRLLLEWLVRKENKNKDDILDDKGRVILVNEIDDCRIFTLPPPDIRRRNLKERQYQDSDFGPPLPIK